MIDKFPDLDISVGTIWKVKLYLFQSEQFYFKIQRKALRYSFKKVAQYVPKQMGNKNLRRIVFIQRFLKHLEDPGTIMFIIDEAGFGTKPLRRYGYSHIGKPAVLKYKQLLGANLTCTATISLNGVEML